MPIIDRNKEREIVEQALKQGKDKDFAKKAVLRFRENQTKFQEVQDKKPEKQDSFLKRALGSFGRGAGKVLDFSTDITGLFGKSGAEFAAPAAQGFGYLATFLTGDEQTRQFILENPLGKAQQVAEEEGVGKGVQTVAGQALQTFAETVPFATGGLGTTGLTGGGGLVNFANSTVGRAAEVAFVKSVGQGIQKDDAASKILKDSTIKGGVAAATSFLLGKSFEKLQTTFARRAGRLFGRTFKPNEKLLTAEFEKNREPITRKLVNQGYIGTTEQVKAQADGNLKRFGEEIDDIIVGASKGKDFKGTIFKKDVISGFESLKDKNVILDDSQLKLIQRQVDKIPTTMSVEQANKFKQDFAKLVPKRAWDISATDTDTFRAQLFKAASGGFRKEIEKKAPAIAGANENWALALDMQNLSSRLLARIETGGGLSRRLATRIGQTLTTPFTATVSRTARAKILNEISKLGNEELVRQVAKFLIVKGTSEFATREKEEDNK